MFSGKIGKLYDEEDFIDLTGQQQDENYECVECGVRLIEFPNTNPFAGKSYICPMCEAVVDSSLTPLKRESEIRPIDSGSTGDLTDIIMSVPEDRGTINVGQGYDIDVEHDEWLRSQGFTIVDKRIEIHKD